ncbi:uncharacterized protein AC631_05631, partial [Debaryomyces fabryi]
MLLSTKYSLLLLLIFIVGIATVDAEGGAPYTHYGYAARIASSCSGAVSATATICDPTSPYAYYCYCVDPNALAMVAGCYHILDETSPDFVSKLSENCKTFGISITLDQFEAAYKNYTTLAKDPVDIKGFNATVPINIPVKLNTTVVKLYVKAYDQFLGNYENSLYYGSGVLGYWALVFLIVTVVNWTKIISPGLVKTFTGPVSNTWRKYVTLPAAASKNKTSERPFLKVFDFLVPSRLETLILVGFVAVTIACCSANIRYVQNDPIFETRRLAIIRYVADRTGIVVSVNMPLLILFAG